MTKTQQNSKRITRTQLGQIIYRFKNNRLAVIGFFGLLIMMLVCFTSPLFVSWDKVVHQDLSLAYISPCREYPFGTDMYGRDMLARMLRGGVYSLASGFVVVLISLFLGILFGSVAGYFGGMVDTVIMRLIDIFLSIPGMLLTLTLILLFGQGIFSLLLSLGLTMFPGLARVVRSSILATRNSEFVDASKTYGASTIRILIRHILPNCLGPVIISGTMMLGATILAIAGMGFLGIGVSSPTPEWGTILSEVRQDIRYYPYLGIIPGIAISLSVIFINFIGDGLRDALDPKMKK